MQSSLILDPALAIDWSILLPSYHYNKLNVVYQVVLFIVVTMCRKHDDYQIFFPKRKVKNGRFPTYLSPLFQNESKCEAFIWKLVLFTRKFWFIN